MTSTQQRSTRHEPGGAAYGVAVFAGVLLVTMASFEILQGLSAVAKDDVFLRGLNYTYEIDVSTWGWITILLGALGLGIGIGILRGQVWAFSAGIGLAVLSALGQFAFLPYYPFWAIVIIALDVLVIWALAKQIGEA